MPSSPGTFGAVMSTSTVPRRVHHAGACSSAAGSRATITSGARRSTVVAVGPHDRWRRAPAGTPRAARRGSTSASSNSSISSSSRGPRSPTGSGAVPGSSAAAMNSTSGRHGNGLRPSSSASRSPAGPTRRWWVTAPGSVRTRPRGSRTVVAPTVTSTPRRTRTAPVTSRPSSPSSSVAASRGSSEHRSACTRVLDPGGSSPTGATTPRTASGAAASWRASRSAATGSIERSVGRCSTPEPYGPGRSLTRVPVIDRLPRPGPGARPRGRAPSRCAASAAP